MLRGQEIASSMTVEQQAWEMCLCLKLISIWGRYGLEKNRGMNTHLVDDDDIFRKFVG